MMLNNLRTPIIAGLLMSMLGLGALAAGAGTEPLTLRVEDGVVVPGQIAAVVIRTYSPRGLTQGQICLGGGGGAPLVPGTGPVLEELVGFEVFSPQEDAVVDADFDAQTGMTLLTFQSPSAGVNETDGPMAVLFYRVSASATPGTSIEVAIDPGDTAVFDAQSSAVAIEPRSGTLDIEPSSAPLELTVESGAGSPGQTLDLAISTERSLPLDSGLLVITFGPGWLADDFPAGFELLTDVRYGAVNVEWTVPSPGRLEISLSSPDHTFNRVPGDVLRLRWPIHPGAEVGSLHQLTLDPASFLVGSGGGSLELALESGFVEILPVTPLFEDGFNSGGLTAWSRVVGAQAF